MADTLDIPNALSIATKEKSVEDYKADEQTIRTDTAAMNSSIPSTIISHNNDNEDTKQQSSKDQQSLSNLSSSSQHKPTTLTTAVDETKITKAITFLSSPSINNISTLDKRNYLQHKIGMTEQEIDLAVEKVSEAKMDDVMKEQDDVPRHADNDRGGRQNGLNYQHQQYRDDPYNSSPHQQPPPSYPTQNNMHQGNQNTQDMSPHSSSSASSIVGGFSLGIFALAAFRWLNGGDFILFPPPSTIGANGESTPIKTEEEEGKEGEEKLLMNINEDDTDESLEEEEYEEGEEDNEEFEEDEYEEAITNLMNGSSSNAQSYHPNSSNQEDNLPSYSELVSEIRTLTTAIQSYRDVQERNNRIVHNKVGREMTNDAMNFLKKKKESEVIDDESKVMKVLLMEVSADLLQIKQSIEVKTNSESTSDESKAGDNDGDIKEKVDTEADEEDTKTLGDKDDDKEADDKEGPLQRIDTALEKIQKMLSIVKKEEPVKEGSDAAEDSSSSSPQIAKEDEKEELTSTNPPSPSSSPTPIIETEEKAQNESSSSPAQPQPQDDTTEQTNEQKQQQLEEAIKTLSTKNDNINDLKAGSQMLYLYCLNISKNPTVPRYRKIYTNNNTFRNKVGKLLGAKEFLSAVGFVERTNCFEWDQGTDYDDVAGMIKSRLDFALVALELLKNGTVKPKVEEEQPNDIVSEATTEVSLSTPVAVQTDIDKGIDLN